MMMPEYNNEDEALLKRAYHDLLEIQVYSATPDNADDDSWVMTEKEMEVLDQAVEIIHDLRSMDATEDAMEE